jgi:nucleotide-binding universal stress UspA family protein
MVKQYKHILVPLDGSELAELAVTNAFGLAQLSQADITVLQVIHPAEDVIGAETGHPIYLDQQWENQRILALKYLIEVRQGMGADDRTVHLAVEMGQPAETIIDYAHKHSVDLIVMATHGRSGLKRWVYGSVADKVLRGASLPVLLVRAHPKQEAV